MRDLPHGSMTSPRSYCSSLFLDDCEMLSFLDDVLDYSYLKVCSDNWHPDTEFQFKGEDERVSVCLILSRSRN